MESPKTKKPTPGIHDEDLNLGYVLHHADAPRWGAHPFVSDLLTPKPKLIGRLKQGKTLPSSNSAENKATQIVANNSSGLAALFSGKTGRKRV